MISGASSGFICAGSESALHVAVSPDGKSIASAGGDFLIRVWDIGSKKEKWALRVHAPLFTGMAFTPSSRWLVSGSLDGTIRVWDTTTGGMVRTLRGHTLGVTGLAFPSDGRRLVSSGLDGTIRAWEWDRDQEALRFVPDYACTCRGPCMSGETEALAARLERCGLDQLRGRLPSPGRDGP
jgi:WD40 repeat protein